MKSTFLILKLILFFAIFAQSQNALNTFPLLKENFQEDIDFYLSKSDEDLLNLGFYKIKRIDSTYYLIESRKIESTIDYSTIDLGAIEKAKYNLKDILNCTDRLFLNSGDGVLHLNSNKKHSSSYAIKNGKEYFFKIDNFTYSLFSEKWFGIIVAESFKTKSNVSIKMVSLSERGSYVSIKCENELMPETISIVDYIRTVIATYDSLPILVWFPNTKTAFQQNSKPINNILNQILSQESLKYESEFKTFSDADLIGCISYNKRIPADNSMAKFRPDLELFFTINNASNKTIIISNGFQYAGFEFENIDILRNYFRETYLSKDE